MKHFNRTIVLCLVLLLSNFCMQSAIAAPQAPCCVDIRGNFDDVGEIDISDLVALVSFMFSGGDPSPCPEEADVDGSGQIDISDLVGLVAFMFSGGGPPADCPVTADDDIVFSDEYASEVTYEAFEGSLLEAVLVSADSMYAGTNGLEITIPGDAPWWSGGAFTDSTARDLSGYNALTFWAKAGIDATLDVAGIANDNSGTSLYSAEIIGLALTTSWQKYVIPFPLAEKLVSEGGMFYFAEGGEVSGYQIWIDEIIFENLATITNPRPALTSPAIDVAISEVVVVGSNPVTFDVDGSDVTISSMAGYFTFESSDPAVVSVGLDGVITAVGGGTATLTATLGATVATGSITVNVSSPDAEPTSPAPTPTVDAADVVSLYSDAYTSASVDTWSAAWDDADVADYVIGSDNTKKYSNLVFAGIEFTSATVDASTTSHFHMDIWTPNATAAPAVFKVKLIDFGADNVWSGPGTDDVEHELVFDEVTMSSENWVSIDIPLSSFTNLTTTGNLAQMIISGDLSTVYLDNIYFYDAGLVTEPLVPAPAPTVDPAYVVSLYSDAYASASIDTWSAVWDDADVSDFVVDSDNMKKYSNLTFAGVEFTTTTVDASAMTYFHMDVWTPSATDAPAVYKVKLVDFGADGVWGGDDVEHELTFDETTMNTGSWVSIDIPMTDFINLVTTGHLSQMIISGDLSTVFVDNIYFYTPPPTAPTTSAPTPTVDAGEVVSVFSDAYTSTDFSTWSSEWDDADVADFTIGSDNLKEYSNLVFSIAEYSGFTLDNSATTHFHMDVWTPNVTAAPAVFTIKLVDFGANGVWDGGGDDTEHELTFDETTMSTGGWVSFDIPLADFTGLNNTGHFSQMILSGDLGNVFLDNIYFYGTAAPATEPTTSAPTPTQDAGDVFSVFSDAYTSTEFETWSFEWDNGAVDPFTIGSDNLKKFILWGFNVSEYTGGVQDISGMTHMHVDVWTPDVTDGSSALNIKLVDYGADGAFDGGDDTEHELIFGDATMVTGSWVSMDIPLADFSGMANTGHLAQMVIAGNYSTIFMDNLYFYNDAAPATEPTSSAPTPTQDAGDVFSVFSDTYTSTEFETWSFEWDNGAVDPFTIGSDNLKKFILWGFNVSEYTGGVQDISGMTHMHLDVWTPDVTDGSSALNIKLVDYGADGAYDGGDDTEHELIFGDATMVTGSWVSMDIPLADFSGMANTGHLAQMVIAGNYSTIFMDNLYFYNDAAPATEPTVAAPTPTVDAGDVISLYSDAYTNETMGFWSPTWAMGWDDGANVYDQTVGSDNIMEFEFFGGYSISETNPFVDISAMTYLHVDVWTADDPTGKLFKLKLVDFGPDGTFDGGDDTSHELTFDDVTMTSGSWVSLEIPMTDFSGLTTRNHLAQLVLSGDFGTIFVDNIYFHQ